jgi:hypothetical protein
MVGDSGADSRAPAFLGSVACCGVAAFVVGGASGGGVATGGGGGGGGDYLVTDGDGVGSVLAERDSGGGSGDGVLCAWRITIVTRPPPLH